MRVTATLPLLVLALACGRDAVPSGDEGAEPRQGGTLVIAGPSDLGPLNGIVNSDAFTQELLNHALFMPLVRLDSALAPEPWLAESWSWEGDSAVTFVLRPDVAWSDGVPTRARDVAFTFEQSKAEETASPNAGSLADWLSVQVLDSLRVRFRIRPHVDPLLALASLPVMPAHVLDSIPPAQLRQAAFNRAPVTNGPFRFVSGSVNDRWEFDANPEFPAPLGGRPHLDRVVWRVIPENSAQAVELRTGGAHLILSPSADQLNALDADPSVRAIMRPSRRYVFVGWNGARPPLRDANVRRALTLAMNRSEMLAALRGGRGELAVGPIAPHHWAHADDLQPLPFDSAEARALLDAAGLRDSDGDGVREATDGMPWRIELKIPANNAFNRDLAEMIRADLAAVGVALETRVTEFATLIDDISSAERRFDAVIMGWEADLSPALHDLFHSNALGGPFQLASYSNALADSLLDAAAAAPDHERAAPFWRELQGVLLRDQPWTFLWYAPDLFAVREEVQGVEMDLRGVFAALPRWWLNEEVAATR